MGQDFLDLKNKGTGKNLKEERKKGKNRLKCLVRQLILVKVVQGSDEAGA